MAVDTTDEVDPNVVQDDAQPGAQDDTSTPSDHAEARQPDAGNMPKAGSDDSDTTSDPLVLAQMEPETAAEPAKADPPKQTTQDPPKTPKPIPKADTAKPEPKPEPIAEEDDPLADLPAEDWSKVSHKAKSQFLSQRKAIRTNLERLKAESEARKQAEDSYKAVEGFVRDQGLGDEEYVNAVALAGMIKRGDAKALPALEITLQNLRKATGQPAPEPKAPAVSKLDDDLAAVLKEAEDYGIDTAKVRSRYAAATTAPPEPEKPAQPSRATAAPASTPSRSDDVENQAILDAMMGSGVQPERVIEHVKGLIQANPALATVPVGQRLRAVMEAHVKSVSAKPPMRTTGQPLSGRGRPATAAGQSNNTATNDPLKLALQPRGRL